MVLIVIVLGVHLGHDRCAALVKGGLLIAAIAEERLDRIKHSPADAIPMLSVEHVLKSSGTLASDIDLIVLTHGGSEVNNQITETWRRELIRELEYDGFKFEFITHHLAHAYAAFYTSPFTSAAIMVADGGGDIIDGAKCEAESYYIGDPTGIALFSRRLQDTTVKYGTALAVNRYDYMTDANRDKQISLGFKYQQITYLLGFRFGQAGKTMGLAAYGNAWLDFPKRVTGLDIDLTYEDYLEQLHAEYLQSNKSYSEFIWAKRKLIAYDLQSFLSDTITQLATNLHQATGRTKLCVAGGVFLNCLANYNLTLKAGFDEVFCFPAAGDDGQAVGAALYGYHKIYPEPPSTYFDPFLGGRVGDDEIIPLLEEFELPFELISEELLRWQRLAEFLRDGCIVAVVQGRSEIGPRALGHRSILASSLVEGMKDRINATIKFREDFRPFAPIVPEEEYERYFALDRPSPYMLFASDVYPQFRKELVGVTHVDGSARIQTVNRHRQPFLHGLLSAFKAETGYPILINTSLNVAGQPMVESAREAILVFKQTGLDALLINDYLICKEDVTEDGK